MSTHEIDRIMDKLDKIECTTGDIKVNVAVMMQKQTFHNDAILVLQDTAKDNQQRIVALEKGSRRNSDAGHTASLGTSSFRLWGIPREFIMPIVAMFLILAALGCVIWQNVQMAKVHAESRQGQVVNR